MAKHFVFHQLTSQDFMAPTVIEIRTRVLNCVHFFYSAHNFGFQTKSDNTCTNNCCLARKNGAKFQTNSLRKKEALIKNTMPFSECDMTFYQGLKQKQINFHKVNKHQISRLTQVKICHHTTLENGRLSNNKTEQSKS